jgi:hypothetical protein
VLVVTRLLALVISLFAVFSVVSVVILSFSIMMFLPSLLVVWVIRFLPIVGRIVFRLGFLALRLVFKAFLLLILKDVFTPKILVFVLGCVCVDS